MLQDQMLSLFAFWQLQSRQLPNSPSSRAPFFDFSQRHGRWGAHTKPARPG